MRRSRPRSLSPPWSSCSCCACRGQCGVDADPLRRRRAGGCATCRARRRRFGCRALIGSRPTAPTVEHSARRRIRRRHSHGRNGRSAAGHHHRSGGGRRGRTRVRADRGSASLVAVAMIAVLLAITTGLRLLGIRGGRASPRSGGADLAALAAAGRLAAGTRRCVRARICPGAGDADGIAADCVVDGLDVVVTVEVTVHSGGSRLGPARAAWHGPVPPSDFAATRLCRVLGRFGCLALRERPFGFFAGSMASLSSVPASGDLLRGRHPQRQ